MTESGSAALTSSLSSNSSSRCILDFDSAEDDTENEPQSSAGSSSAARKRRKLTRKRRKKAKDLMNKDKRREKLIQKILDAEPELDNLDASLMCPVCLDLLFEPFNVVPCKHTFCETCLRRIGSKDPMNTTCPMCRQRIVYCERQNGKLLSSSVLTHLKVSQWTL